LKSSIVVSSGILGAFVLVAVFGSLEMALALFFGWIGFLARVLPELSVNWSVAAIALTAVGLFSLGVHWVGRTSYRNPAIGWRWRWSLSVVLLVFVLFAAGIGLVGIVHQTGWLLAATEPLKGSQLKHGDNSNNNLSYMGMGMGNYLSTNGTYPPGGSFLPNGTAKHSWETYLLPYIGYSSHEIDFDSPWNSPRNEAFFKSVPSAFINRDFRTAELVDADGFGLSHYAANVRILGPNRAVTLGNMGNGTPRTILIGEVNSNFKPWGDPVNWRDPANGINTGPNSFGGPRSARGALFLMANGSVRFQSEKTDPAVLKALADPARSELTNLDP
jgi:hypothetical protein